MGGTPCLELNRPQIMDETIDGEVVAIDMKTGSYFSIRGFGVDIWDRLQVPQPIEPLISDLASTPAAPAGAADEIRQFLGELEKEGLLRRLLIEDADAATQQMAGDPSTEIRWDDPPVIEKFTDMEDLLLLDPVHEVDGRGWPHLVQDP